MNIDTPFVFIKYHFEGGDCSNNNDVRFDVYDLDRCFGPIANKYYKFNYTDGILGKFGSESPSCIGSFSHGALYEGCVNIVEPYFMCIKAADVLTNMSVVNESLIQNRTYEIYWYEYFSDDNCTDFVHLAVLPDYKTRNSIEDFGLFVTPSLISNDTVLLTDNNNDIYERNLGECYTIRKGSSRWHYEKNIVEYIADASTVVSSASRLFPWLALYL
jgi:hypothetical protein